MTFSARSTDLPDMPNDLPAMSLDRPIPSGPGSLRVSSLAAAGQRAKKGGDKKSNSHDGILKLSDLGITLNQSSRYQLSASLPAKQFEKAANTGNRLGFECTRWRWYPCRRLKQTE
jgi:hypothetical protein